MRGSAALNPSTLQHHQSLPSLSWKVRAEPSRLLRGLQRETAALSPARMKCAALFLVLFMVVLMAQPGECFFGMIIHGLIHVGKAIHSLIKRRHGLDDQLVELQLDRRSVEYRPGRPGLA
uniref:Uncharacterized protein n=1 Tax=Salarias fasciatus TaxID=181472 RepID=A0A672F7C1_SALFA